MLWKALPLEFHSAYICAPPALLSWKLPAGYCTRSTGPDAELPPGGGELGKGSAIKSRLEAPFWMRPLERPQLDVMKDWVSELPRVAVGKGIVVLVESEYCDAADAGGVVCASVCVAKRRKENASVCMAS